MNKYSTANLPNTTTGSFLLLAILVALSSSNTFSTTDTKQFA